MVRFWRLLHGGVVTWCGGGRGRGDVRILEVGEMGGKSLVELCDS